MRTEPVGTRNGSNRFAWAGTAQGKPLPHLKPRCRRVPDEFAIRAKQPATDPCPRASSDPRQPRAGPDSVRHRGRPAAARCTVAAGQVIIQSHTGVAQVRADFLKNQWDNYHTGDDWFNTFGITKQNYDDIYRIGHMNPIYDLMPGEKRTLKDGTRAQWTGVNPDNFSDSRNWIGPGDPGYINDAS